MDSSWMLERLMMLIPLVLSLTVHEWAHAFSAYRLGDDTAERLGRLTLNPVPHIDPIGTLLLPLMGVPFGWARPVPVNPTRFRSDVSMTWGMMLTAVAGPLSNLILAFLCVLLFMLGERFAPETLNEQPAVEMLLVHGLSLNIALCVFNLLPVPPLDGSRVVDGLVPYRFRDSWERFSSYAPFVLLGLIMFGSSLIAWPTRLAHSALVSLAASITGY